MRTKLYMQAPGAKRAAVVISISRPQPDPKSKYGDKRVFVRCPGLSKRVPVHGIDDMQATALAFLLLRGQLRTLAATGVRFYLTARGRGAIDLGAAWFNEQFAA